MVCPNEEERGEAGGGAALMAVEAAVMMGQAVDGDGGAGTGRGRGGNGGGDSNNQERKRRCRVMR